MMETFYIFTVQYCSRQTVWLLGTSNVANVNELNNFLI